MRFFFSRSLELLWPFWLFVQKETRRRHLAKNVTGFFLLGFEYLFIALRYFHCYANKVLFDIQRPLTKLCFWYAYIILCAVCHFSQLTHNTIFYLKNQSARCICFMLHQNRYKRRIYYSPVAVTSFDARREDICVCVCEYVLALHIDWMLCASSFFGSFYVHYFYNK